MELSFSSPMILLFTNAVDREQVIWPVLLIHNSGLNIIHMFSVLSLFLNSGSNIILVFFMTAYSVHMMNSPRVIDAVLIYAKGKTVPTWSSDMYQPHNSQSQKRPPSYETGMMSSRWWDMLCYFCFYVDPWLWLVITGLQILMYDNINC